jgi:tRNA A37 threonylcarbamoyladenosine modification protein TsaB
MAMVLSKPVIGVSALEALALATWYDTPSASRLVAWTDAQRGEVFAASFTQTGGGSDFRAMQADVIVAPPDVALAAVPFPRSEDVWFVGDGALRYRELIVSRWGKRAQTCDSVPALAPAVARLGQRLAANGAAGPPHALQPLYVRRPDAELDRERQAQT